jgi:serine/threonine protein kinase
MIHGDLKGVRTRKSKMASFSLMIFICQANILIDESGNARVADFGLTAFSDLTITSSYEQGGTTPWMSPELLGPEPSRRTKSSDCYALGMVVYEVLSGHEPFQGVKKCAVIWGIIKGNLPGRPEGEKGRWFTDAIWHILEDCWKHEPSDRPSIDRVFECLDQASDSWTPFLPPFVGPQTTDSFTRIHSDPSTTRLREV